MKISRVALVALIVLAAAGVVSYAAAPGPNIVGTAKFPITVKAGGMFTENPGVVHSAANTGSVPTRVAASYLIPKGAEVITWVK